MSETKNTADKDLSLQEIKKEYEDLLKSQERYKRLIEGAPDISYIFGTKSGAKFWSPQVENILGIKPETLLKDTFAWVKSIHPEDQPKIKNLFNSLGKQKTFSIEYRVKDTKGNWHWLNDRTLSVRKVDDEYIIEGLAQDITEKKQIEEELKLSEEKFRKAFLTNPDSININRLSDGLYVTINNGFTKIMGYEEKDVVGKTSLELNIWADPDDRKKLVKGLMNNGVVENLEAKFIAKDGKVHQGLMSATLIDLNGEPHIISITRDISDLKEISLALKESEEKYRLIVENANDGIEITQDDRVIYANNRFAEMLGYEPEEIKDLFFSNIFTDKAKKDLYKRQEARRRGEILHHQYSCQFKKKDGSEIDVEINYQIIEYKNKPATFAIIRDISQSKAMERELIKLSTAVEQSPSMIVITDIDGKIEYINPIFTNITGFELKDIEGKTPRILKSGVLPEKTYRELWDTILSGKTWRGEFLNKKKSGKSYWENAAISPIKNDKGEIDHFVKVAEDITEWKNTEKALEQSEEQYRLIVENAKDGILISQNDKFIYKNAQFVSMLGYNTEEFEDITFKEIYTEEGLKDLYERNKKREAGEPLSNHYETSFKKKDGTIIYVEVTYELIDYHNETATFAIVRDITEKKEYEKKLKDALDRAEESDHLKSAFLANMSHEIRTPMNGIIGFTNLLKKKDLSKEKTEQYLDIIEKSGQRLMNIINDLIDISKIEAKQIEINRSNFKLNDLIEFLRQFFEPECSAKDLYLKTEVPDSAIDLYADKDKLEAVLINLLKNAIKFTNEGGITFGFEIIDKKIKFFVKDTGIGIPGEKQKVVFDRFAQVDNSISRPYEGAGLGLSISSAFVEMLGGELLLDSEYRKGSVFHFSIPHKARPSMIMLEDKPVNIPAYETDEESVKKLKILIAEDDPFSFQFLEILLKNYCDDIIHANNGKEAVDLCVRNPDIDLILMDVKMPVLDGNKATKNIRKFNQDVIIIAQTAYAFTDDQEKMMEAGCNDYITKPISEENLKAVINKWCKK